MERWREGREVKLEYEVMVVKSSIHNLDLPDTGALCAVSKNC